MILISGNQPNKIGVEETISKSRNRKMPVFDCSCGTRILIVPDLCAMDEAIKNHLVHHEKLTGFSLSEERLTQEILQVIIKNINET